MMPAPFAARVLGLCLAIFAMYLSGCSGPADKPEWRWVLESRPYAEPLIDEDRVYVVTQAGEIVCGVYRTGEKLWIKKIEGQILGDPAKSADHIYVATDRGDIHALRKDSGATVWTRKFAESFMAPLSFAFGSLYAASSNGNLYGLSAADGTVLWSISGNMKYSARVYPAENSLLIGGWGRKFYSLKPSGEIRWEFMAGSPLTQDPLVEQNNIYLPAYDSYLYALDLPTGKLHWVSEIRYPTNVISSNGELVVASEGNILVIQPQTGKTLRTFRAPMPISRLYSVDGRCLVVAKQIYELDPKIGQLVPSLPELRSPFKMAFPPGFRIVTDELNSVFAFRRLT